MVLLIRHMMLCEAGLSMVPLFCCLDTVGIWEKLKIKFW